MAATHVFTIGGSITEVRAGWSLQATANGRNTLQFEVVSLNASNRPALDAVTILDERVVIVTSSNANPTHIITEEPHGVVTGQTVEILAHDYAPLNTTHIATRISETEITIPVASTGGTGGTLGRRIFGGTINKPIESGLGDPGVPIKTHVEAVDYNAQAERRFINEVITGGTLKSILIRICAVLGMTLHPSQPTDALTISAIPCVYTSLTSLLNLLSTLTGYVWEFDEYNRLRMFLPNTEAAPFDITDGDHNWAGDITVEPTRTSYANRVILRFSNIAIAAWGYLFSDPSGNNISANDTVSVGGMTYIFKTFLGTAAGEVLKGGDCTASLSNLAKAINHTGTPGVDYTAATLINTSVEGWTFAGSVEHNLGVRARTAGAAGNSISVLYTPVGTAYLTWGWEGFGWGSVPITALNGGADAALIGVSIAEDPTEQIAHGIWEVVVESPETTDPILAATLSAAYLAVHLLVSKKTTYESYKVGLRPGQKQTMTIAGRDLSGIFLLTDVSYIHQEKLVVRRTVNAIEGLILQAAERWQDTYRKWSGDLTGSSGSVSGSGGGGGGGGGGVSIIGFGGSQTEWQQTSAGGWIAANSIQVRIDTVVRGSAVGTCYVRLRASAGTVTARLARASDSTVVGTSSAVAATAWATIPFPVALITGSHVYEIQISPSVADTDVQLGSAYLE